MIVQPNKKADYALLWREINGVKRFYNHEGRETVPRKIVNHKTFELAEQELQLGQYGGLALIKDGEPVEFTTVGDAAKPITPKAAPWDAKSTSKPTASPAMVSGFGQFHTNEADPAKPQKKLTPYAGITFAQIQALVDQPQRVEKSTAQWLIPSILSSRDFKRQEADGLFLLLWLDLDENPPSIDRLAKLLDVITSGCDFEIYTTRSATADHPKSRALIPLAKPLSGAEWVMCQEVLNDLLAGHGVVADRASQRPAQLCYLPNRGDFYQSHSQRDGVLFNPLAHWSEHITKKRETIAVAEAAVATSRAEAQVRRATLTASNGTSNRSVIDAFNEAFPVEEILLQAGYAQRGNTFRHPRSQSGSFSASLKNGRVHALSSSDPLFSEGQGAHDAFSAFTILMHGGDQKVAMKDAGDNWLTIGGESWNKIAQREYMKTKDAEQMAVVDVSAILRNGADTPLSGEPASSSPANDMPTTLPSQKEAPGFVFVPVGDLVREPKPVYYLIDELVEDDSLCMLFGGYGTGKSFVSIGWAASIATGQPWIGRDVCKGAVFYLAGEGHAGIARRLKAWEIESEVSLADAPLFISKVPAALMDAGSAKSVEDAIKALAVKHGKPALIVIDTFARNLGNGEENKNSDIGIFVNHIDGIRSRLGGTFLIVHHSGHMEKERGRGGSSLPAAMDSIFMVKKSGTSHVVTQKKAKESEDAPPITLCRKEVPIGWRDAKGREMTSAVMVSDISQEAGIQKSKPLTPRQQEALQAYFRAVAECQMPQQDGDLIGIDLEIWRIEFNRTCTAESVDAKKKAFQRVRDDLVKRGFLRVNFNIYYVHQSEPGLIATRLTNQMDKTGHGTWPGHAGTNVPATPPSQGDNRDTHL